MKEKNVDVYRHDKTEIIYNQVCPYIECMSHTENQIIL